MIQLWPFQATLIESLRSSIRAGNKSPLVVSPTGSGKTVMFSYLTSRLAGNGFRTNILCHRAELMRQICTSLDEFRVRHNTIQAGIRYYNPKILNHVSSAMTIVRRLEKTEVPDYCLIDEGHHAIQGSTWGKIIEHWRSRNPNLIVAGWTATPERLSGEGLNQTYDDLIVGPSVAELIEGGYLADYKMYAPAAAQKPDFSRLHKRAGDFVRSEADAIMDKPRITGDAIAHYRKFLNGAPAVAFTVSVEHAHHVADQFKMNGFRAAAIDGKMTTNERQQITDDFARGQLNVMTSCDLISEGYDVPGMMGAILLRPTESLALYLQQVGRALRRAPGKPHAILLDHVGNSERHGLPDTEREWSLEGHAGGRKSKRDPDDIAIRQCAKCGSVNRPTATHCRDCGFEFPVKARKVEVVEGDLEEVDKNAAKYKFVNARAQAQDMDALVEVGKMRGMKNPHGWAKHVLAAREAKKRRRMA